MKTLILIEDHQVLRDSLAHLLESTGEYTVVAQSAKALEVHDLLRRHDPDILLMDIVTEEGDGLEEAIRVKLRNPKQRVYLLSGLKEHDRVETAKRAGIDGYLLKDLPIARLLEKLSEEDRRPFPELEPQSEPSLPYELTRTELAILELLGCGHSIPTIADKLNYSPHTIKKYISRTLLKSGCSNRAMLLTQLTRSGHINPWKEETEGES